MLENEERQAARPAETPALTTRHRLLDGARLSLPITDGLAALLLLLAAAAPHFPLSALSAFVTSHEETLRFALMAEGSLLMLQWSLVDIAASTSKRPPLWAVLLIGVGLIAVYPEARNFVLYAWQSGAAVLVPVLLSLAQRFTILWTLPTRPAIEKMAADALVQNRVLTALGLFGGILLLTIASRVAPSLSFLDVNEYREMILVVGAIYFAIATFDDRRVRGREFARRPRVMFQRKPMRRKNYAESSAPGDTPAAAK